MRILLYLIFCCITSLSFSQSISTNKYYIHLFSDTTIYGEYIRFEHGFLQEPHLKIDGQRYNIDQVEFYENHFGNKANIKNLNSGKCKPLH